MFLREMTFKLSEKFESGAWMGGRRRDHEGSRRDQAGMDPGMNGGEKVRF